MLAERAPLIGGIAAAVSAALALVISVSVGKLSAADAEPWEFAGAVVGALLWTSALGFAFIRFRRWRVASVYGDADELAVARHHLAQACWYLLAKTPLTAIVLLLYAAVRWNLVLLQLRAHPLALFLLALLSMALFTIFDALDLIWGWLFIYEPPGSDTDDADEQNAV